MLVLTRKLGERIFIADTIVVTVLGTEGNRVRLGIDAPPHISILRQEVQPHRVERTAALMSGGAGN